MNNILIQLEGSDLSSRRTAAVVRQQILNATQDGNQISVDLSEVKSISESYADEAFGVIVANKGLNWLVANVHILSNRESVLKSIATAIRRRLKELELDLDDEESHALS